MTDSVQQQFDSAVAGAQSYIDRLKERIQKLESRAMLPNDFARNRMDAIIREAVRLHIENIVIAGHDVTAVWCGREMRGEIFFDLRGSYSKVNLRPRVRLELYFVDANGFRIYHVKSKYKAALEIVYARQRMMVYNRLMSTMLKVG